MRDKTARPPTATIRDVARELGMSIATVSRALTRPELLREDTRERVLRVVERLGYRPNLMARGLRKGRTRAMLLVAPNLSPFFLEIFAGAEEVAREAEFALLLGNSGGDPERETACFDQVVSGRADGIILLTGALPSTYAHGRRPLPPVVTVLERVRHPQVPVIRTDHRAGAAEATQHLIALGHRRIAHILGIKRVASTEHRLEGYRSALQAAGLPCGEELLYPGDFSMASGTRGMEQLLQQKHRPTAVLCANDEMAFGAVRALHQMGLSVPGDISLVGFDDLNMAAFYNPPLTTVHIPRHELGRQAALELIKQIEGRAVKEEIILPTRLVIRESTAAARPRGRGRAARASTR